MKAQEQTYWLSIRQGFSSLYLGLKISFRHFVLALKGHKRKEIATKSKDYFKGDNDGVFTLQYPRETFPVPETGRYRLYNEIDDCIVCDKCAKVCPVNCIDIQPIKSSEEIRKTSDGSSVRLYAGVFDIDMAKCCFCGLCTTVCPTECLTMTKTYDFSELDVDNLNYHFSELSPEEAVQKQEEFDIFQAAKKLKREATTKQKLEGESKGAKVKVPLPTVKKVAPKIPVKPKVTKSSGENELESKPTPKIPKIPVPKPKRTPGPVIPKKKKEDTSDEEKKVVPRPKPVIKKPTMKPVIKPKPKDDE